MPLKMIRSGLSSDLLIGSWLQSGPEKVIFVFRASAYRKSLIQGIVRALGFTRSRRFFRAGRSVLLLNVLVIVAIGATSGFTIWDNRQSALEEHRNDMKSMGVVLAEQTSRYVQVIDLTLRDVQSRIAQLNVATPADF
jgi:hypothetical protein